MSAVPKHRLTPEEYLAQERGAQFKSEFYRGETFAMAGATRENNLITGNVLNESKNQLRDRPCEVYSSDMRVKIRRTGLYTYPDVAIVCAEPQFEDDELDTLLNPTVLCEVLSKSTEGYDRGVKAAQYRRIPSLKEYVVIAQDRPQVERYLRQPDGGWLLQEASELTESITLESVGVVLPLAEIYRQVTFEQTEVEVDREQE
jgi:Uma2 family endonuclease